MSLTPDQARLLDTIACQLRRTDPRLARRLTGPLRPALSRVRELVVLIVLLAEMALGFLPLAWGLASFSTLLLDAGLVSAFIATPALMWFTTTWAQHRWVRFEATR